MLAIVLSTVLGLQTASAPARADQSVPDLPARQVHLDFHTSQWIPEVGTRFDKTQFQQALKLGHVNWINLFAKCHHSWSYYPTTVGRQHPNLKIDLLGQQIEACHEIGVRCPFYFTVGWSATNAQEHPQWCVRNKDGSIASINWDEKATPGDRRPVVSWRFLCPGGAYRDLILRQSEELCRRYPVDGFWYDITHGPVCYCERCREGMAAKGIDFADDAAVSDFNARKWKSFYRAARQLVAKYHPQATVFFNNTTGLTADNLERHMFADNTQQELEDLPTTWGGYDKLALRAKYFHNFDQRIVAMSGKFHTMWGEFGGFKHPDAIRYEAAAMIAHGVACNFGDQLHPCGEMDLETYRNIGHAYTYVEQIEAFGIGGKPASRLGVWLSGTPADDEGVSSMLGKLYHEHGARLHRDFFANALRRIYRRPMVHTELPSAGRITLLHQPEQRRYVAHLLYAPPLQRGHCLVIEDLPELRDVPVELKVAEKIEKVYKIPGRKALSSDASGGAVRVSVPAFTGHCAIVFEY